MQITAFIQFPKDLTRCNNIPQCINTSTKVMLLLPNDTKLNDIHLQFPSEHAYDDTVQRISLSSRQGQQHPLVVASVGNPDQPNNQIFTLEKQTFSPTKVKIVSVGHTTLSWSRDWPTWLRHLNSIPTTFDSIVVIAIYCFGFFIRGSREKG